MVQLLQQLGADITIKDKVSLYFVFFMYLNIVSYVIEHLFQYGKTPTDLAEEIRHSVRECFHSGKYDVKGSLQSYIMT